jgi:hypothetical protein
MKSLRYKPAATNILICAGAYFISMWMVSLFSPVYWKLTNHIIYSGEFAGMVLMPLVNKLPAALAAACVGASVIWLVDSRWKILWPILPALLYAVLGLLSYHWARPPQNLIRSYQIVSALFPAITCLIAGIISAWRLKIPSTVPNSPDYSDLQN